MKEGENPALWHINKQNVTAHRHNQCLRKQRSNEETHTSSHVYMCMCVCDVNGSLHFSHKNQFEKEIARSSMTQANKQNNY